MKKISYVIVIACALTALFSCKKDNNAKTSLADVQGSYSGTVKMSLTQAPASNLTNDGQKVEAIVKNNKIVIDSLPLIDIIKAVVGPESAPGIVALVGKVGYEIDYTPAFGIDQKEISMTLKAKPILLTIPPGSEVSVAVTAEKSGVYKYAGKTLTYAIHLESVTVGGNLLPTFKPMDLTFSMTKK